LAFTLTDGAPVLPPAPEQQGQKAVRVLPPQGGLVATPRFSGVGEPALVRGNASDLVKPQVVVGWVRRPSRSSRSRKNPLLCL
jgi:hypothetical protein